MYSLCVELDERVMPIFQVERVDSEDVLLEILAFIWPRTVTPGKEIKIA